MFQLLYVEESVKEQPITRQMIQRHRMSPIYCEKYGEIFNRQSQNFRLQKENPSLILAKKNGNLVLETPEGYGIGTNKNFYFSHLLNCPFDCRYCFLQGLYSSANFVLFVNYQDFKDAIVRAIEENASERCTFFSGYDADSLALESITQFVNHFLPFFEEHPEALFEIRTKSTNISTLLRHRSLENCVIAYSLMPHELSKSLENKTPSVKSRLESLLKLQQAGWPIGLRFDPLIFCDDFEKKYAQFYAEVFDLLKTERIHSVTLGAFRMPKNIYKNMVNLYPEEKLFAHSLTQRGSLVSYKESLEQSLLKFCYDELLKYVPSEKLFAYDLQPTLRCL
ncbi:MAG: radical SAM protein [Parachlamydiaceae bacterium]